MADGPHRPASRSLSSSVATSGAGYAFAKAGRRQVGAPPGCTPTDTEGAVAVGGIAERRNGP